MHARDYLIDEVTGAVLAGGEGRRMGGVDKGLTCLAGKPMVAYALAALEPQCVRVIINANRNQARYAALGHEVVADTLGEFFGPLAGMASCMAAATTRLILFAPCDSPLVSTELGKRLYAAKQACGAQIAVARDAERYHPVFALMDTTLADSAVDYLESGERKIDRWFDRHRWIQVDCADLSESFLNVNRTEEREALEARLSADNKDTRA